MCGMPAAVGRWSASRKPSRRFKRISKRRTSKAPRRRGRRSVFVQSEQASTLWGIPAWLQPFLGPASTAGLVVVLVIFMLLEREELRGRLIGLLGHGNLAVTTKAFDEAGRRVSRQLLMQALVSAIYGACAGVGLWAIGVPYPLLWSALGAALRFVPYLGPIAAAAAPLILSLAVFPGWIEPLWVLALFIALELFTNLVLETVLYAGAAGVSQVALLVAVAGWTWLWGAMGLLLATPLTVCLVVLGKHVSGLEFLSTLIADSPALAPDISYYQRLLARDQSEAADLLARHLANNPPETVYDALLVPALNYAEQDRLDRTNRRRGRTARHRRHARADGGRGGAPPGGAYRLSRGRGPPRRRDRRAGGGRERRCTSSRIPPTGWATSWRSACSRSSCRANPSRSRSPRLGS